MAAAYRKAIVAAIGVGFIVFAQALSAYAGLQDQLVLVVDGVIGILTAFGVFQASNEPLPPVVEPVDLTPPPDEEEHLLR